ncbi:MAG: hypothetical protein ABIG66_00825 [Candidatus Kerfeldbacteria bacterium]
MLQKIEQFGEEVEQSRVSGKRRFWNMVKFLFATLMYSMHSGVHVLFSPKRVSFAVTHDAKERESREAYDKHVRFKRRAQVYSFTSVLALVTGAIVTFSIVSVLFPISSIPPVGAGGYAAPGTYVVPEAVTKEEAAPAPEEEVPGEIIAPTEPEPAEEPAPGEEPGEPEKTPEQIAAEKKAAEEKAAEVKAKEEQKAREEYVEQLEIRTLDIKKDAVVETAPQQADFAVFDEKQLIVQEDTQTEQRRATLNNYFSVDKAQGVYQTTAIRDVDPDVLAYTGLEFEGESLPEAEVHIDICSSDLIKGITVSADANGDWDAEIAKQALGTGKHSMVIYSSVDGIETERQVVGNIVNEEKRSISATFGLILSNVVILWIISVFVVNIFWKERAQAPSVGTTAAPAPEEAAPRVRLYQVAVMGLAMVALIAVVTYNFFALSDEYEVTFSAPVDLEDFSVKTVNAQELEDNSVTLTAQNKILISGVGTPEAVSSFQICDGIEIYAADINDNGNWSLEVPLEEVPNGDATYQVALQRDGETGETTDVFEIRAQRVERTGMNWLLVALMAVFVVLSIKLEWDLLHYEPVKVGKLGERGKSAKEEAKKPAMTEEEKKAAALAVTQQQREEAREQAMKMLRDFEKKYGQGEDKDDTHSPHEI